jgi:hypothetical protein
MASRSVPPCDHELRPGITVCLRCQHAERAAQRAKQRQMMARGGAAVLALAVVGAVGVTAASTWISRASSSKPEGETSTPVATTADSTPAPDSVAPTPATPVAREVSAAGVLAKPAVNAPAAKPVTTTPSSVSLVVPVGRTELRDTIVAVRSGDTVRVSFDLLLSRTRRADKFEAIVRSTLPQVFGSAADSALRALPYGSVARAGDLIETLPSSGFHIPLTNGRTIAVWPETRVGRDGPLVIAYRAVAR